MNKIILFIITLFVIFSSGCSKSGTGNKEGKNFEFKSGFYCKIDGRDFYVPDSVSYFTKDDKSFTLSAKIEVPGGQYDDFFFYINTPAKEGEFSLSHENKPGHVQYNTNYYSSVKSDFEALWSDSGNLILSKMSDNSIEGKFSIIASGKIGGADKKINITEGKFKLKLN